MLDCFARQGFLMVECGLGFEAALVKQTVCGAAGPSATGAGSPNRSRKDKSGMKKSNHSTSRKGGLPGAKPKRNTPAQKRSFKDLAQTSRGWRELTEDQRIDWRRRAEGVRTRTRRRRSRPLKGQQLFNKINSVLALLGRERRTEPPPEPRFGPNPVSAFTITGAGKSLALKLRVSGPLVEEIMVFASPPLSAGRGYCGDFRFLGLLPAPVECLSDITRLYLKKFGVPPPDSRIFIRVWQEVDGWECRAQMRQANALVPARADGKKG
jgi:hypothetical protein